MFSSKFWNVEKEEEEEELNYMVMLFLEPFKDVVQICTVLNEYCEKHPRSLVITDRMKFILIIV